MAKSGRSTNWGFPRWGGYNSSREAQAVRVCDRWGCDDAGDRPAPKSPNSKEKWYFCEQHAGEYNRNWDYFQGLSKEEAAARGRKERSENAGYQESAHHAWTGPGDGSRSRDEMTALEVLGVEVDATFEEIRKAYRLLAKKYHPDVNQGDAEAEKRFQAIQAAYNVLRVSEENRSWKPRGE